MNIDIQTHKLMKTAIYLPSGETFEFWSQNKEIISIKWGRENI